MRTAARRILGTPKAKNKVRRVMREYSKNKLRSGSKKGPKVKDRDQAIAIAISEAKRINK